MKSPVHIPIDDELRKIALTFGLSLQTAKRRLAQGWFVWRDKFRRPDGTYVKPKQRRRK